MLKIGNDHFETTQREPRVDVCNRRYVFDAQPPPNSPNPLVFNPTENVRLCRQPGNRGRVQEKRRADEREYAQLLEDNVPAAPIYSGLDGGMNKAFLAQFPCRVTLAKVMPYGLTAASATDPLDRQRWLVDEQMVWHSFSKPIVCDLARAGFRSSVRRHTGAKPLGLLEPPTPFQGKLRRREEPGKLRRRRSLYGHSTSRPGVWWLYCLLLHTCLAA